MEQNREGGGLETPKAEPVPHLRATARLHEIERRLRTVRFTRSAAKWIGAPVLAGAGLLVVYVLLRASVDLSPSLLVPFSVSLVALSLLRSSWKKLRTEEKRLRAERTALAAGAPARSAFELRHPSRP